MNLKFKELWLHIRILFLKSKKRITLLASLILFLVSLASIFLLVITFGYDLKYAIARQIVHICIIFLSIFFIATTIRYLFNFKDVIKEKLLYVDIVSYLLLLGVLMTILVTPDAIKTTNPFFHFMTDKYLIFSLLGLLSLINISKFIFGLLSSKTNPSLIFINSFLLIILIGTGLLMLPNSYLHSISFVDALFTSTTSVCVTGLCTVDVANTFTFAGQLIILVLIQIGGIGVMTFTSFFALSFMGHSTFGGTILLKDFLNEENMGSMFRTLVKILIVTFLIEMIGAYFIWQSIHGQVNTNLKDEIFIAVFHAISAFCNAGISVFHNNLTNPLVEHNYMLHFLIAILIVLGGLGFPIVFNYMKLVRHVIINIAKVLLGKQERYIHQPRIINIHSRIVVVTTGILLVTGTILILISEYDHTFAGLSWTEKTVSAFFNAVTPRTAGFNNINMTDFTMSTLFIMLILMMIGAAPMSTGGGIKVSTFAVAVMSVVGIARGKKQLEISGREIDSWSVGKAYAVVVLYISWMFIATYILTFTEKGVDILTLLFEVVSALSTVGLSLNFSPNLSEAGKYIIIFTMFIGRIGVLMFLSGILKRYRPKNYKYPETGVIIG